MAAAVAAGSTPRHTPSTQTIGAFVKTPGAIILDVMAPGDTEKGRFNMAFGKHDPCENCSYHVDGDPSWYSGSVCPGKRPCYLLQPRLSKFAHTDNPSIICDFCCNEFDCKYCVYGDII